ncbi:unnamed protein product [Polarella glacialis]|uniref:Uncharacterized protein n=1 Tax=Polarella glacialis TaxID=89957 RepID=A0A813JFP9_POLGL|nr:unnamed protein product [Polarella glacialis]
MGSSLVSVNAFRFLRILCSARIHTLKPCQGHVYFETLSRPRLSVCIALGSFSSGLATSTASVAPCFKFQVLQALLRAEHDQALVSSISEQAVRSAPADGVQNRGNLCDQALVSSISEQAVRSAPA